MIFNKLALAAVSIAASATAFTGNQRINNRNAVPFVSRVGSNPLFMTATVSETEAGTTSTDEFTPMRPPINLPYDSVVEQLSTTFGYTPEQIASYDSISADKESLLKIYKALNLARAFENSCNQQYMQGKIRGFMHL